MKPIRMRFLFFLSLIFFVACTNKEYSGKKLNKDEFKSVLVDMHMTDAIINAYNNKSKQQVSVDSSHYDSIFKVHDIEYKDFLWNMVFYANTQELSSIYQKVIDELNQKKGLLNKQQIIKDTMLIKHNIGAKNKSKNTK